MAVKVVEQRSCAYIVSMKQHTGPAAPVILIAGIIFLAGAATGLAQAAMTAAVDGTVASISTSQITLTAADGSTKSAVLSSATIILERTKTTLGDIKKGDAMGVTAHRAPDGNMTATIINIFPVELWKVVRKGQFPMQQPGQIMTNALVDAYAEKGDGHQLTMSYRNETYSIVVPDETEVYRLSTVNMSTVKMGMHVLVRGSANSDGSIKAAVVSFDG